MLIPGLKKIVNQRLKKQSELMAITNMLRVVLDSNIYISSIGFGGNPKKVVSLGIKGEFQIVLSEFIISEVTRVCIKKLKLKSSELDFFFNELLLVADLVTPSTEITTTTNDGDNIVLATAIDGHADYIVTGDKAHLIPIQKYQTVKIVTLDKFMQFLK
ncbi:MAG: putative toxin-antitoxin system toxin component, PIN family [Oligoflexia bacterium]|nr:putative toxin-antitoxin system toxin component, PIN family [Oligoflexia bacterium]